MQFTSAIITTILSASAALAVPQNAPAQRYKWNIIIYDEIYTNSLYEYSFNIIGAADSTFGREFNTF
jgi:hypothetical protein